MLRMLRVCALQQSQQSLCHVSTFRRHRHAIVYCISEPWEHRFPLEYVNGPHPLQEKVWSTLNKVDPPPSGTLNSIVFLEIGSLCKIVKLKSQFFLSVCPGPPPPDDNSWIRPPMWSESNCSYMYFISSPQKKSILSCADPEGSNFEGFFLFCFFSCWEERGSKYHNMRTNIGPPAKRHLNGVSRACR